ncbi:MAG: hypothetical protein IT427_00285 [Pirellulales bacterium]|nr:hypothetical protein [Pirellulales bacterium]
MTARDTGFYGGAAWGDPNQTYPPDASVQRTDILNFSVRNVSNNASSVDPDLTYIIDEVRQGLAHDPDRTMLVRINFWDGEDRYQGPMLDRQIYRNRLMQSIRRLEPVLNQIHGISLAEENVPSGGRTQLLQYLYEEVKQVYPNLPVYQWWSPNTAVPSNYEGTWLQADGWIIDPYTLTEQYTPYQNFLPPDPYRRIVPKYLITGKPLLSTIPATAEPAFQPMYDPATTPFNNQTTLWNVMDHQRAINIAYNVPTLFYWSNSNGSVYFPSYTGDPLLDQLETYVNAHVQEAANLPADYSGNAAIADVWNNGPQTIVNVTSGRPENISYEQKFYGSEFLEHSEGTGFRDMVVDGEDLRIRGFTNRNPDTTMIFHFRANDGFEDPLVALTANIDATLNGQVRISVSRNGTNWSSESITSGHGEQLVELATSGLSGYASTPDLWVRVRMNGAPGSVEHPPVRIDDFRVLNNTITTQTMLLNVNFDNGYLAGNLSGQNGGVNGGRWSAPPNSGLFEVVFAGTNNMAAGMSRWNSLGEATIPLLQPLNTATDHIRFVFDFYRNDNNDQGVISLRSSSSRDNAGLGVSIGAGSFPELLLVKDSFYTQPADAYYSTGVHISNDRWYLVEINANGQSGKYDAYLTDRSTGARTLLAAGLTWETPNQFVDEFFYLPQGLSESQLLLDNIRVFGQSISPSMQPGDFESDGDVDGADFVVWQTHFPTASGATPGTGDADSDGDVDGADFVVWQTHFPTIAQQSLAIPEPSPLRQSIIAGGAIALLLQFPRRTNKKESFHALSHA